MLQYSELLAPVSAPYAATSASMPAIPNVTPASPTGGPAVPNVSGLSTTQPSQTASAAAKTYTVASGDTLSGIASKNGMTLQQLLNTNPQFKANPNLIKPGQTVTLGGGTTPAIPNVTQTTTTPSGVTVNPATGGVVTPPAQAKVQYGQLVNDNGTIFNTNTKQFYSSEDQLAADLGIDKSAIDWNKIGAAGTDYNAPQYQVAEKNAADLMAPTADEEQAQKEIDNLQSSLTIGKQLTEDQVIPMEFITGQQKSMEDRTLALEQPLEQKLARLQAKRQGALQASQFTLSQMDKKISAAKADAAANKPVEIGNGGTLVDPKTGKVIYQAPYRSSSTGGGGNPLGGYIPGANPTVDAWIEAVANGNATMAQVPANVRNAVAEGLAAGPQAAPVVDGTTDAAVKAIIQANKAASDSQDDRYKAWDAAAKAIDAKYGKGTATKYDDWLHQVYEYGNQDTKLGAPAGNTYSPLASSRYTMAANRIESNYVKLPIFEAVSQGQVYLPRIKAAAENPGSVGDAELLDSIVKLNTGGNAITEEQVRLITGYGSYKDKLSTLINKFQKGGALSTDQRKELTDIAKKTFENYQKAYQPVYNEVTKKLKDAQIPEQFWTMPNLNKISAQTEGAGNGGSGSGNGNNPLGI